MVCIIWDTGLMHMYACVCLPIQLDEDSFESDLDNDEFEVYRVVEKKFMHQ